MNPYFPDKNIATANGDKNYTSQLIPKISKDLPEKTRRFFELVSTSYKNEIAKHVSKGNVRLTSSAPKEDSDIKGRYNINHVAMAEQFNFSIVNVFNVSAGIIRSHIEDLHSEGKINQEELNKLQINFEKFNSKINAVIYDFLVGKEQSKKIKDKNYVLEKILEAIDAIGTDEKTSEDLKEFAKENLNMFAWASHKVAGFISGEKGLNQWASNDFSKCRSFDKFEVIDENVDPKKDTPAIDSQGNEIAYYPLEDFTKSLVYAIAEQCSPVKEALRKNDFKLSDIVDELNNLIDDELLRRKDHLDELSRQRNEEIERSIIARAELEKERAIKAEEDKRKARRAARERAVEAAKARRAFMAVPQPYKYEPEASELMTEIKALAGGSGKNHVKAEKLSAYFSDLCKEIDVRDKNMATFGKLLLSGSNIAHFTEAMIMPLSKKPRQSLNLTNGGGSKRELMNRLYKSSTEVQKLVDKMLNDEPYGILLLASLTLKPERCKEYGIFYSDYESKINTLIKNVKTAREKVGQFSDEEIKALEDTQEVIALRAAEKLLADNEHTPKAKEARENLVSEIRAAFEGRHKNKSGAKELPKLGQTKDVDAPPAIISALNGEFSCAVSEQGDKFLHIYSNEFPYKGFDIKRNSGSDGINSKLSALKTECEQHRTNLDIIENLIKKCGFSIDSSSGETVIVHPEYNISVRLSGSESDQTKLLMAAQDQYHEAMMHQESMLESMQQAGVKITRQEQGFNLSHSSFGEMTLAARGYFTTDDFTTAQEALRQAQPAVLDTHQADPEPSDLTRAKSKIWSIESPKQTFIIFDATTLNTLAAERNQPGRTWLDIIKQTSRLPNVTVIIPSVVADWETRGRVPVYDDNGKRIGFEQIDLRYTNPDSHLFHIAKPIDHFVKSASRARILANGQAEIEEGATKNVVIIETPEDRDFFKRILEINQSADPIGTLEKEIRGKGEGEKSITRIIEQLPFNVPAMIVSDDRRYIDREAPRTTPRGKTVGVSTTGCYLDAELRARGPLLEHRLREQRKAENGHANGQLIDIPNENTAEEKPDPLTLRRIHEEILAFQQKYAAITSRSLEQHGDMPMLSYNRPGQFSDGNNGIGIYRLIREGAEKERETLAANSENRHHHRQAQKRPTLSHVEALLGRGNGSGAMLSQ